MKRYKRGDRVVHKNHGAGTVYMDTEKEISWSDVTIEFDVKPDGWLNPLTVSKNLVKPVEENSK